MKETKVDEIKQEGDDVLVTLRMNYDDYREHLKGQMQNIILFSSKNAENQLKISCRGSNEATKYFLVPIKNRKKIKKNKEFDFQFLETEDNIYFIYSQSKEKEKEGKYWRE